jgi:hypothetical protein
MTTERFVARLPRPCLLNQGGFETRPYMYSRPMQ